MSLDNLPESLSYNSIPPQQLTHGNALTVQLWNEYINMLRVQTNDTTTYAKRVSRWITTCSTDVNNLLIRMHTAEDYITNLTTRATALEGRAEALEVRMGNAEYDIDRLESVVTNTNEGNETIQVKHIVLSDNDGTGYMLRDSTGNLSYYNIPNADTTHTGFMTPADYNRLYNRRTSSVYQNAAALFSELASPAIHEVGDTLYIREQNLPDSIVTSLSESGTSLYCDEAHDANEMIELLKGEKGACYIKKASGAYTIIERIEEGKIRVPTTSILDHVPTSSEMSDYIKDDIVINTTDHKIYQAKYVNEVLTFVEKENVGGTPVSAVSNPTVTSGILSGLKIGETTYRVGVKYNSLYGVESATAALQYISDGTTKYTIPVVDTTNRTITVGTTTVAFDSVQFELDSNSKIIALGHNGGTTTPIKTGSEVTATNARTETGDPLATHVCIDGTWWKLGGGGGIGTVTDVKIGNTSLVNDDGVASIPVAGSGTYGVVTLRASDGIWLDGTYLAINPADESKIDGKTDTRRPIVPSTLDYAVMKALSDPASSFQGWTSAAQAAARETLGITGSADHNHTYPSSSNAYDALHGAFVDFHNGDNIYITLKDSLDMWVCYANITPSSSTSTTITYGELANVLIQASATGFNDNLKANDILAIPVGSTGKYTIVSVLEVVKPVFPDVVYLGTTYSVVNGKITLPTVIPSNKIDGTVANATYAEKIGTSSANFTYSNIASIQTTANNAVKGVTINGASVVSSGVANIPVAGDNTLGVVKTGSGGITIDGNNKLTTVRATDSDIAAKTNTYKPIVPSNLVYATKVGMLGNTSLTDTEKTTLKTNLGITTTLIDVEVI